MYNYYLKHDSFLSYGHRKNIAHGGANSILANIEGSLILDFKGEKLECVYGDYLLHGVVFGARSVTYKSSFYIIDRTNNLISFFEVNPKETGFIGSLFGLGKKNFPDYLKGYITDLSNVKYDKKHKTYSLVNDKVYYSVIEGEFTNYLNIDGKEYWSNERNNPAQQLKQEFTLESDSRLRDDLLLYKNGQNELSQYAKMRLEDIQRNDVKLRKQMKLD